MRATIRGMIGAMSRAMTTKTRIVSMAAGIACAATAVLSAGPVVAARMTPPACTADDLSARQTGSTAGMSQPTALITVTNTGAAACTLRGYPTVTGRGAAQGACRSTPGAACS